MPQACRPAVTTQAAKTRASSVKLAKRQMLLYNLKRIKTTSPTMAQAGTNMRQAFRYIRGMLEKRQS